jgi:hypothetical protein
MKKQKSEPERWQIVLKNARVKTIPKEIVASRVPGPYGSALATAHLRRLGATAHLRRLGFKK